MRWILVTSGAVLVGSLAGCEAAGIKLDTATAGNDSGDDTSVDTGDSDTAESDTIVDTSVETGEDTGEETGDSVPVYTPDWTVDCNGAGDHTTIQAAIEAAHSGDDIEVMPCVYHERLDYLGKTLNVYGAEGSAHTTIDGGYEGTVVNVESGEGEGTRLAGFRIQGGYDASAGSAVEVGGSVLALDDVVLSGNGVGMWVLQATGGWVDAIDVVIGWNEVQPKGGAIYTDGGTFVGERLTVDCGAGVYGIYAHVPLILADSEITCAAGSGIYNYHGEMDLRRIVVTGGQYGVYSPDEEDSPTERVRIYNSAIGSDTVGAYFFWQTVEVYNSVLWGAQSAMEIVNLGSGSQLKNSVLLNSACGISGDKTRFSVSYTDFWNNTSDLCNVTASTPLRVDPMFTAFPGDLSLLRGSGLVDAGDPAAAWEDLDGSRNDVGVYGGPAGSP